MTIPSPVWDAVTTAGFIHLYAPTQRDAILSALELLGPGARLVRCSLLDQWSDHSLIPTVQ